MKQGLISAALAVAAIAAAGLVGGTGAFAQSARQDVAITAIVPKFCTVGGRAQSVNLTVAISVNDAGTVSAAVQSFTAPSVICNTAADVIATSMFGGAKNSGTTTGGNGFTAVVDYISTASFGDATATIDTAVVPGATAAERGTAASTSGASIGNLVVVVTPIQPKAPLMPGSTYTDHLRVTLQPK